MRFGKAIIWSRHTRFSKLSAIRPRKCIVRKSLELIRAPGAYERGLNECLREMKLRTGKVGGVVVETEKIRRALDDLDLFCGEFRESTDEMAFHGVGIIAIPDRIL